MRNQRPKTFVTPGVLAYNQYGTTGRFGNGGGGGSGYPFTPTPFSQVTQSTIFSEPWGEYASGETSVVAAANWTFSGVTLTSIINGLNQINYPANTPSFNAHTAALAFNAAKGYSLTFELAVAIGAAATNNLELFAEDDGTGNVGFGVIIQADGIDGNSNATFKAAGATVGVQNFFSGTASGDHIYRLAVTAGKQMTLFVDNVQVMQAQAPGTTPTGSKMITMIYAQSSVGNHGDIGPIIFKAFKT